ncbi:MAG: hypothetical protein ACFCUI_09240, partial [Bernardetiaceae bacterium]
MTSAALKDGSKPPHQKAPTTKKGAVSLRFSVKLFRGKIVCKIMRYLDPKNDLTFKRIFGENP